MNHCYRTLIRALSATFLLSVCASTGWSAPKPSFTGLGSGTFAYEVTGPDITVVGRLNNNAAIWRQGTGWTDLSFRGFAYGISKDGQYVTGWTGSSSSNIGENQAYRWSESGGLELLPLDIAENSGNQGLAISADGQTVVGAEGNTSTNRRAFRWSATEGTVGMSSITGMPPNSQGRGVSGDGTRIIGRDDNSEGWLWDSTTKQITNLTTTPGGLATGFSPWAISADGTTVVGNSQVSSVWGSSYWTEQTGVIQIRAHDGNGTTEARDVSADGSLITGYYYDGTAGGTAYLWDSSNGVRELKSVLENDYDLDLTGWQLRWAYISDDGTTLAGAGFNPDGQDEAWVAVIPEPASGALFVIAIAIASRRPKM